ncbi:unnamed protein product, partial [Chrysoparadoxa australica]
PWEADKRHVALVAGLVLCLVLLLALLALFSMAPTFGTALAVLLYVLWWFVSSEKTRIHSAQEHENRFWTLLAFVFSSAVFYIHDSPLAIGRWSPSAGFLGVVAFTFGIHYYDRHLHRHNIGRVPNIPACISSSLMLHTPVQEKCEHIQKALEKIDSSLVATNIQHFLNGEKRLALESIIINTLADADPDELNYMLPKVKLGLLFYKVKDHPGFPHRTRLMELLALARVADLTVSSRALVLDALQQVKLTAHPRSDYYARNLIIKTMEDDLSRLKGLTDNKGDFHSIHKLIYNDFTNQQYKQEVLQHIARQAAVQEAHMRLKTRAARVRMQRAWRKVLSDVDDTLLSSGGRFPAGIDKSLPRKALYPGVLDFYRELDLGIEGPEEWPEGRVGNLVFLSARPHVYKDISEAHSYR